MDILNTLCHIGQEKIRSSDTQALIHSMLSNENETVRAYASWALDQITDLGQQTLYHVADINVNDASDSNPGTEELPWKTIQKAAETARAGDTIIVHGGIYRECIRPLHSGLPGLPITYQAADGESPIVKACDIWDTQWEQENGYYSTPYVHLPWDMPNRFIPNVPENRCEQLFVDGHLLKHSKDPAENSFWVDDESKKIWINIGKDPNKCLIERSMREQCLMPAVRGLEHIIIKGFTFVGGAAHPWSGGKWFHVDQFAVVSVNAGRYWTVEDNVIEWGNAQGLQIAVGGCFAEDIKKIPIVHAPPNYTYNYKSLDISGNNTFRRNKVRNNGISGIVGFVGVKNILIEDNEVSDNCQKGFKDTCEECGMKFHVMTDSIIRRNVIINNNAHGLWLDGLCQRNRITQNIFVNNNGSSIFYELSDGPILIDNNIILDTRESPSEFGLYNQDGNYSIVINNVIIGPNIGARVRALFHRQYEGGLTTTIGNFFFNNVMAQCKDGCVSLMPEVSRCSKNHSNYNIFWNDGGPIFCKVENTSDVGIPWESLPLGKALGYSGEGSQAIRVDDWKKYHGEDSGSEIIPYQVIFGKEQNLRIIMDVLLKVWRMRGLDLDGGGFTVGPINVHDWIQCANSDLQGHHLSHTLWMTPFSGAQIWDTIEGSQRISWDHKEVGEKIPLDLKVPYEFWHDPITIAEGDSYELLNTKNWTEVVESKINVDLNENTILFRVAENVVSGDYCAILKSDSAWTYIPITVTESWIIQNIEATSSSVKVTISNRSDRKMSGKIEIEWPGGKSHTESVFLPHSICPVEIPVNIHGEEHIHVKVITLNKTIVDDRHLSFASASQSDGWGNAEWYEIKDIFPSIIKPLVENRTRAKWSARYTNEGVFFKIVVNCQVHNSFKTGMSDMEGLHSGDCIKIGIKGYPGDKAAVIGLTLRSDTGEQVGGFNKTANEGKYPVGRYALNFNITKIASSVDASIIYEVMIAWDMINLSGPDPKSLFVSILACKNDGDLKYDLHWFKGLRYDEFEGKESAMGQLWLIDGKA